ncbi:MAG: insulinase family protein [Acidobacteriales bacterium]|nr:insulinase family protein [Terriglobales bacterium]
MKRSTLLLMLPVLASTALHSQSEQIDRTKPPATGPIPDVKIQHIERFRLPNGLEIVTAEDNRFPLTTFELAFMAGSKFDPADLPGLSDSVAALINQGTATRSAQQIAELSADLGGRISATSIPDTLTISGSCLSENVKRFIDLLADVARKASFPEDEVQLQKQNRLQQLRAERSDPAFLGRETVAKTLFASTPYAHIGPTEQALNRLDRASLEHFRDTYLVPNNAFLVIVGKLPSKDEVEKLITASFGSWEKKDVPDFKAPSIPANKKQLVLVDRPSSVQANVFSAHVSPTWGSSDIFPIEVGDRILGGGANSRLFMDIREKRSFAYDAHSETDLLKDAGTVMSVTEVRNEVVQPAIQALNDDMQALSKENVGSAELTDAKNSYAGIFILRLERQTALARQLLRVETMGLPKDFLDTYMTHVRSVEPDEIRRVAKYWDPGDATLVVVGDAQKIQKSLEGFGTVQVQKPQP